MIEEVVADKGYHSRPTVLAIWRRWSFAPTSANPIAAASPGRTKKPNATRCMRIDGASAATRGKRLLRGRGELLERPCAHLYETGGLRRTHVRGHENMLKRLLVHAGAFNLGLWMRTLFGVGTPRGLQGRVVALGAMITAFVHAH